MTVEIFFDGLCEPQPGGIGTYGYVIYRNGRKVREHGAFIGRGSGMTNNVAEYSAVVAALEWAKSHGLLEGDVVVKGDSQLVIRQLQGKYKVRSATSKRFSPLIRKLAEGVNVRYEWVAREENREADLLSKNAHRDYVASQMS